MIKCLNRIGSHTRVLLKQCLDQISRFLRILSHVVLYVTYITFHVFIHNSFVILSMEQVFHSQQIVEDGANTEYI
jgi:hypothetical protein